MSIIKSKSGEILYDKHPSWPVKKTVEQAIEDNTNLRSANLRSANLRSADLRSANLRSANLRYADLRSADLRSADLRSADLRSADLRSANLRSADLRSADLRSADLRSANLRSANLRSANLRSADLRSADLRYADLQTAYVPVSHLLYNTYWGELSDKLTLELMRHDAEFLEPGAVDSWAKGNSGCPYADSARDFMFCEKAKLWKPGKPKLRGIKLLKALCDEKNIKYNKEDD